MPDITLHYFDVRGRGEIIRMLLTYAGQKFTDHRVSYEEWATLKPKTPLGSLPVVDLGGEQFTQSGAIAYYFADQFGLHGVNNLEALQMDVLYMMREDIIMEEGKYLFAENDAKKEEVGKKLGLEVYPKFLSFLAKVISENRAQNKSDFAVGTKFSLADMIIYEGTQNMVQHFPTIIHAYPEVKNLRSRVEQIDGLKEYLNNRPVYPM